MGSERPCRTRRRAGSVRSRAARYHRRTRKQTVDCPADEHVGVGQELHVSLGGGERFLGSGVLAQQFGTHLLLVELYHDPAGSIVHLGMGAVSTMVPSLWRLASCWKALWVPGPISKSLFFPPSRHTTSPLLRSTLYTVQVFRAQRSRLPSGSTSMEVM
jgi:hypothetical protein